MHSYKICVLLKHMQTRSYPPNITSADEKGIDYELSKEKDGGREDDRQGGRPGQRGGGRQAWALLGPLVPA